MPQLQYKNNIIQQLRGFCYAAQFGNISRAATHMGLTHASVSLQIKALEESFGIALFKRNGPKIMLTREGEALLDRALPYLDGLQSLREEFTAELAQATRTELRIALNSTTLNFLFPKIAKAFLAAHPDVFITIHYAEHEEAMRKLHHKDVDLALLPRREHKPFPKEYDYVPMFSFTPSLITRPDHPLAGRKKLTVQEISRYELTLPAEDLRVIPNLYDIFPQHRINKKLRINFKDWETTRKYIEEGLAISISSDVIISERDMLVATPLDHLFAPVSYGFVVRNNRAQPANVSKLIDIAQANTSSKVIALKKGKR